MTARQRSAGLALLVVCASLTAALSADRRLLGAFPPPARTTQGGVPSSPEPPLADPPEPPPPAPGPGSAPGAPGPVDPPVPAVAVRVRVPATIAAGQELTYRICVQNTSRAAAHHVLVRNPLPANARFVRATPEPTAQEPELQWQLGTLQPGVCREIQLVLAPTGGDVQNCARVQFEHGQCVTTKIARSDLSLRATCPTQAQLYDSLTFRLEVTNPGDAPISGVQLTGTLPEGLEVVGSKTALTWALGTLAPGQTVARDYQVIAKKSGQWCSQAVATTASGLRQEASACVTVAAVAKLEIKKTGPAQRYVSRPATYQILVSNPGPAPAANVFVTDPLPKGTDYVSASDGGQFADNQVRWTLGTLAPGARKSLQVVLRATAVGEVVNRATVAADRIPPAASEVRTLFEGAAGLTFDIDEKDDPVEVGAETAYTITVLNQGDGPATNVVVAAVVPEQMQLVDAKGGSLRQKGARVEFDAVAVPPRQVATFMVRVKAVKAGEARFKVEMAADQLSAGPVRKEQSTTVYDPNPP